MSLWIELSYQHAMLNVYKFMFYGLDLDYVNEIVHSKKRIKELEKQIGYLVDD